MHSFALPDTGKKQSRGYANDDDASKSGCFFDLDIDKDGSKYRAKYWEHQGSSNKDGDNAYVLTRQLNGDAGLMAGIVTLQTMLSVATLPLVLSLLAP